MRPIASLLAAAAVVACSEAFKPSINNVAERAVPGACRIEGTSS